VLWSRAKTPAGVVVDLGSAATDELGRAGFGGMIDNHWWERFGSAFLLSVVGDASKAAVQSIQQQSGASIANTGNAGKDAASIAVEQGAQIRPTLHKNQGELVAIFVARDLDFSSVYRLTPVDYRGPDRTSTTTKIPYMSGGGNGGLK
jgi:type IV secretion system protein VirB10